MKNNTLFFLAVFILFPCLLRGETIQQHQMRVFGMVGTGYPTFLLYGGGVSYNYQVTSLQHFNADITFWGGDDFNLNAVGMNPPFFFNTTIAYGLGTLQKTHKVGVDLFGIGYSLVTSEREYKTLKTTLHKHGVLIVLPSLHVTYKNGIYTGWKNTFTFFVNYNRYGNPIFDVPLQSSELFEFKSYLMIGYEFNL